MGFGYGLGVESSPRERVRDLRQSYETAGLTTDMLAADWPSQLDRWMQDAMAAALVEPNWMVLATADSAGRPSARSVLLKGYDSRGLVLFTNYESRKGRDVAQNPAASLVIPWIALQRQVVVVGAVERTSEAESDAYFAIRPHGSKISAARSPQSQVIASRDELATAWDEMARQFPEGSAVPRPAHWGGLRVIPETVEFWQGRKDRLHDRLRYRRSGEDWIVERLAP